MLFRSLNIAPSDALVLEDSLAGIEAASRAGIPSVLVEDDITDLEPVLGKHLLKQKLPINEERLYKPTYQFDDLLEVKEFLKSK